MKTSVLTVAEREVVEACSALVGSWSHNLSAEAKTLLANGRDASPHIFAVGLLTSLQAAMRSYEGRPTPSDCEACGGAHWGRCVVMGEPPLDLAARPVLHDIGRSTRAPASAVEAAPEGASAEPGGAAAAKHQVIFGECECDACAPGGGGAPAAGEREVVELRAAYNALLRGDWMPEGRREQFDQLMDDVWAALRAPAPPREDGQ